MHVKRKATATLLLAAAQVHFPQQLRCLRRRPGLRRLCRIVDGLLQHLSLAIHIRIGIVQRLVGRAAGRLNRCIDGGLQMLDLRVRCRLGGL